MIGSNLNVEYNFLRRRFSPLVRAGAGFYNFSDLDLYAEVTHDETDFAWNIGGGLRWNITDHLVVKLVGGALWTELKDSSSVAQFGFVTPTHMKNLPSSWLLWIGAKPIAKTTPEAQFL